MADIPDLPPNPDGTNATAILNLYMTNQIIPNCTKIFAGGNIPDDLIVTTRARFQDVNKLIAQILGELPSEQMKIGKNTVIIGTLPENSEIGDGNVIISSFDMIKNIKEIGCNAKADFGAIAIGTNARAITVLKRSQPIPFVTPLLSSTAKVASTPTLVFGSNNTCEIISIIIVNRTANPLLVDLTILREIDEMPLTFYLANKIPIAGNGKQEILNLCLNSQGINYTDTILYLQNGDTMHANSNFINNTFDCLISYREFTELPIVP